MLELWSIAKVQAGELSGSGIAGGRRCIYSGHVRTQLAPRCLPKAGLSYSVAEADVLRPHRPSGHRRRFTRRRRQIRSRPVRFRRVTIKGVRRNGMALFMVTCVSTMGFSDRSALAQSGATPNAAQIKPWPGNVDFELGSPTAPVVVEEYFSDTCPHCAQFDLDVLPIVRMKYVNTGLVRLIFRELPTSPIRLSALGFIIARCGGRDTYLRTLDQIFRNQAFLIRAVDLRAAALWIGHEAGLSESQTQSCINNDAAYDDLDQNLTRALQSGITGTPSFVVNGRLITPGRVLAGRKYNGGSLSEAQFSALVESSGRKPDSSSARGAAQ